MLAFTAGRLLTPTDAVEHPLMLVEQGRVLEISARSGRQAPAGISVSDFGDGVIAPGYVDLHIHGSAGYDVMDDTAEALPAIGQLLARHGVTSYFPTTVSAPMDATLRALERLADAIENREQNDNKKDDVKGRSLPLGIHLEGPFISHARRGVHPAENLLAPKLSTFEQFWQAARGRSAARHAYLQCHASAGSSHGGSSQSRNFRCGAHGSSRERGHYRRWRSS